MEITNVTKLGVTHISDNIRIGYTISLKGDSDVKSMTASIISADEIVGFVNSGKTGDISFSFTADNGLTDEEKSLITAQVLEDASQVFGTATPGTPDEDTNTETTE
jgi:hypothetical protein